MWVVWSFDELQTSSINFIIIIFFYNANGRYSRAKNPLSFDFLRQKKNAFPSVCLLTRKKFLSGCSTLRLPSVRGVTVEDHENEEVSNGRKQIEENSAISSQLCRDWSWRGVIMRLLWHDGLPLPFDSTPGLPRILNRSFLATLTRYRLLSLRLCS